MAVKLRLTRMGAKKAPFYRIVAVDSRQARDSEYIEQIGYYNPVRQPAEVKINADLAVKWINNGAQPTDTVKALLKKAGIIATDGHKITVIAGTASPVVETPVAEDEAPATDKE